MSLALEHVTTTQTSSAATRLPLELQQLIFSHLDTRSFYAARKVCQYWHFASTDAVPLAKQLRRLPILPRVDVAEPSNPADLEHLFEEAARTLMISVRVDRAPDRPGSLRRASKMCFPTTPRIIATTNGSKTVTLNGRQIALFDTSTDNPVCLAQRPLNDLKETVGSGPWLKTHPNSYNELALSSNGRLLAVAQERTVQIYNLDDDADSFTVNQYISSATGHYICGLDFEQQDHVLRVRLSGKGTVVYLGSPPTAEQKGAPASMDHWKSKAGLLNTFLDSSLLPIPSSSRQAGQMTRVCGVQILQPFHGGWLFAAQKHGGGESSHYILGHVKTSCDARGLAAASKNVTILARLESYLSSWDYTLEATSEGGLGLWENMPSAHEHHPRFALDIKRGYLALAERDKKRIRPAPLSQLFLYRVPRPDQLQEALIPNREQRQRDMVSTALRPEEDGPTARYDVPRMPLCLSTVQGDITDLAFTRVNDSKVSLSAATSESIRTWLLEDL